MRVLTRPDLVEQKLQEMDRSLAWLGRQVNRSRQRMSGLMRSPGTTLVPDEVAVGMENALKLKGKLFAPAKPGTKAPGR